MNAARTSRTQIPTEAPRRRSLPGTSISSRRPNLLPGLLLLSLFLLTACDNSLHLPFAQPTLMKETSPPPAGLDTITEISHLYGAPEQAKFERISLEQGLSQSSIYSILQDSQGFMWFGTQDGLNRYDGYRITVLKPDPEEPNSLSNNFILSLHEDQHGILWIGTNGGGLNSLELDTGLIGHYPGDGEGHRSLSGNSVFAIHQDEEGILWLGTDRGLNRFDSDRKQFTLYQHDNRDPHSLSNNVVRAIVQDSDGALWIGTEGGGLDRFDRQEERFTHYSHDPNDPHTLSHNVVTSIHQDSQGAIWVGTEGGGLNLLDPLTGRFTHYRHEPDDPYSLGSDHVQTLHQDRHGMLWIGTRGEGLDRFDQETGRFIHYRHDLGKANSLSNDWVQSLVEDRAGILWIGTLGGGLNILGCSGKAFLHYQAEPHNPNSLGDSFVWSIYQDRAGILWIGTFGGGLDRFDRQTGLWNHYQHNPQDPNSLGSNVVRAIQQDPEGMLWLGTDGGGLDRFDPETGRFTHYKHDPDDPHSLSSDSILTLYVDHAGTVWVGAWNGLNKLDRSTGLFTRYSLDGSALRAISEDRAGTLWLGTENGLHTMDPATAELESHVLAQPILSIHHDLEGGIWLGTFGGGLVKFDRQRQTFAHLREKDGLPSDVVYGILDDDKGGLWLSTNLGLSRFDPQTETFTTFDVRDGVQSNEFNSGAYHKNASGEMFFGGVNGFNAFYPDSITRNYYKPPIVLTALTQNSIPRHLDPTSDSIDRAIFRWPDNSFEFEFAALNYCQPERNQYAYMLEGLDKDWYYVGTQRTGRYTNLPGKNYTLRIIGSNNDDLWNMEGTSLRVTVVPPFWQTWWFRGLIVLLLIGGIVAGVRLRIRSVEAHSRELERQVMERTRTLAERSREIERRKQELEALYRADAELHRHLSLDQVLQALVDIAVDILQADKSALMAWDDRHEKLVVRVARGYSPETLSIMTFNPGNGTVGHVATTGQPVAVKDAHTDPRLSQPSPIIEAEGIHSFMQVPIKVSGEIFGVFSADYMQPRAFGTDEKRLFLSLAQRAALAIDTAQLHEKSQELAVLEERSRLARDLHDAVTQTLFSSSLIAETVPQLWDTDPEEGRQLLKELRQLSRGALAEMRTLLLELRPAALAETNLGDLLRQLGEAITGQMGTSVVVTVEGQCVLPSTVHVALYRIAQEALNNVVKHSAAGHIAIGLRCTTRANGDLGTHRNQVELCVIDDGQGFDPERVPPDRLGLGIIRERAQSIGAAIDIQSRPGHGTKLVVTWQEAEAR
jgi:ligand-binding sensor domain-containing protein/signal transduction histidine kinase